MEREKINILYIEDNNDDALIIEEMLAEQDRIACSVMQVHLLETGIEKIGKGGIDVILLDLSLPDSHGFKTFETVRKWAGDLPIIVMTGLADESMGVKSVKEGAQDYLVKGQVNANGLGSAICYAIERQKLVIQLKDALEQVKTLRGILPICAHCKKIRDDNGYWRQVEVYIRDHTDAKCSHGICPECIQKHYHEFMEND